MNYSNAASTSPLWGFKIRAVYFKSCVIFNTLQGNNTCNSLLVICRFFMIMCTGKMRLHVYDPKLYIYTALILHHIF